MDNTFVPLKDCHVAMQSGQDVQKILARGGRGFFRNGITAEWAPRARFPRHTDG